MNHNLHLFSRLRRRLLAGLLVVCSLPALAGPGAHGPNGEHLDAPPGAGGGGAAVPRIEASSELFELVGTLAGGALSILIDRFATNEPLVQAQVEVESGGVKAVARFHADIGDFSIDDPALITKLSAPGEHPLVITILAGDESDLLEGVLKVSAPADASAHEFAWSRWAAGAAAAAAVLVLAALAWRRRRARSLAMLLVGACTLVLVAGSAFAPPAWAGPGAHGPNGEHLDSTEAPAGGALARLPDGSVNVPKLAQRRMGLRTLIAPQSQAAVTVQLPARVVADPNASGQVQAAHGGRIEPGPRGLPVAGQAVRAGEVLAWVRHHAEPYARAGQVAQRAELQAARELAEQRVRRLESLEGTVPRKEIDAARVEAQALAARERSIAASLDAREPLVAPVSGVIARTELKAGQIVEPREILVEVVDPRRLMVEASTADVALGAQVAGAHLAGMDGIKLQWVGAARVLRDGMLPLNFRVSASAKAPPLALGQTVTLVAALKEQRAGIVLPAAAVVRNAANQPVVWIKASAERFVPQPVQVQALDATTVLVTQGLSPDNRVVVQGATLVAQIR